MSDDEARHDIKFGDVNLIDLSTPAELATSLPSALAQQADDENKLVGTIIMDRFLVESVAGHGGMSVVYKAKHLLLKKTIALKTLHKQLANQARYIQRFKVEAQAASSLSHENIVSVFDFGVLDNDQAFLAMEYVAGEQLAEVISRERHMHLERAIDLTIQCCNALEHAHNKGIVHRDLKPSNVILTQTEKGETVKLVDFGIAKVWSEDQNLTRTGETLGSPPYMSPEQCRGDELLDARSDIYSLGCLFYEMLCGKAPLVGGTVYETIHKQINEMPPSISHTRDDIKAVAEVDAILMTALSKNPQARFQSMAAFRDALIELKKQSCGDASVASSMAARCKVFVRRHLAGTQNDYRPLKIMLLSTGVALAIVAAGYHLMSGKTRNTDKPLSSASEKQYEEITKAASAETYERAYARQMQLAQSKRDSGVAAVKELQEAAEMGLSAFGEQDSRYLKALELLRSEYKKAGNIAGQQKVSEELNRILSFRTPLGDPIANSTKIQDLLLKLQSEPNNRTIVHHLVTTLTNQAEIYGNTGRHAESEQAASQAISLSEKHFPNSILAMRAHLLRARDLRNLGREKLGLKEYAKAGAIARSNHSDEFMNGYASYALSEGKYWTAIFEERKKENFEQAIAEAKQAVKHFRNYYHGPSPLEADALEVIGRAQAMLGQFKDAERSMSQSIEMSKTVEGPSNRTIARRVCNLGWVYWKERDWKAAERTYKQAEEMINAQSWGDNVWRARLARQMGKLYIDTGREDEAERYLKQSLTMFARTNKHSSDVMVEQNKEFFEAGKELLQLYTKQGRLKDITRLNQLVKQAHAEGRQSNP